MRLLVEHLRLLGERRVAEREPHREPVELRLGQRIRALVLDRVLRRDHHERPLERIRDAVDRDLALLHALEQRRLRLRRRAVHLVDEQQVREHRARPELELVRALVEDVDAGDVGRQQVGRELEPREGAVERARERLREHRLPDAREVLDDQVALRDEAEHDEAQRLRPARARRGRGSPRSRRRDPRAPERARAQPSRRSTSSRIAAAISSFGAFAIVRSPAAGDERHLVVARVEADVVAAHVVEDEQVGVLVRELLARPLEAALALVGGEADEHLPGSPAPAELGEDVGRRLELDGPGRAVLRALRRERLGRPVVGDGGGHDHDVGLRAAGERLALELRRARRLDELDARAARRRRGSRRAA